MFEPWLRVALGVLAVYRLTDLVVYDKGPFGVFKRLRAYLGMHTNPWIRANLGSLVNCPYCVGVWAALAGLGLVVWATTPGDLLLLWLGLAGGQALLKDMLGTGR